MKSQSCVHIHSATFELVRGSVLSTTIDTVLRSNEYGALVRRLTHHKGVLAC